MIEDLHEGMCSTVCRCTRPCGRTSTRGVGRSSRLQARHPPQESSGSTRRLQPWEEESSGPWRSASRSPPPWPWQPSNLVRCGATSLPGPSRRLAVHVARTGVTVGGAAFERRLARCQRPSSTAQSSFVSSPTKRGNLARNGLCCFCCVVVVVVVWLCVVVVWLCRCCVVVVSFWWCCCGVVVVLLCCCCVVVVVLLLLLFVVVWLWCGCVVVVSLLWSLLVVLLSCVVSLLCRFGGAVVVLLWCCCCGVVVVVVSLLCRFGGAVVVLLWCCCGVVVVFVVVLLWCCVDVVSLLCRFGGLWCCCGVVVSCGVSWCCVVVVVLLCGVVVVVVSLWWCCGGVVVVLWWCCGVVVVLWCCGVVVLWCCVVVLLCCCVVVVVLLYNAVINAREDDNRSNLLIFRLAKRQFLDNLVLSWGTFQNGSFSTHMNFHSVLLSGLALSSRLFTITRSSVHFCPRPCFEHLSMGQARNPLTLGTTLCVYPVLLCPPWPLCHCMCASAKETGQSPWAPTCSKT